MRGRQTPRFRAEVPLAENPFCILDRPSIGLSIVAIRNVRLTTPAIDSFATNNCYGRTFALPRRLPMSAILARAAVAAVSVLTVKAAADRA